MVNAEGTYMDIRRRPDRRSTSRSAMKCQNVPPLSSALAGRQHTRKRIIQPAGRQCGMRVGEVFAQPSVTEPAGQSIVQASDPTKCWRYPWKRNQDVTAPEFAVESPKKSVAVVLLFSTNLLRGCSPTEQGPISTDELLLALLWLTISSRFHILPSIPLIRCHAVFNQTNPIKS
jgi:hypothetical protein